MSGNSAKVREKAQSQSINQQTILQYAQKLTREQANLVCHTEE